MVELCECFLEVVICFCLVLTDVADSQSLVQWTSSSSKPHQLQKLDDDKQRIKTGETAELRRHKTDIHINVDSNNMPTTVETALNDLAHLSARNQSYSSAVSSATSTTKFGRKVLNCLSKLDF